MPLITSKQVWTQQPQHAVEIDWANPLSKDLIAAFVFSNGLRDLVTGQFAENKGGIFVDSPLGRCFKAITAGISLPWDLNCTSADITITAVEYKTQTTNGYWFIADARSGSYGYVYGNDDVLLSPSGTLTRPGYKVSSFCKNEFYQEGVKTSYVNDAQPSPRSNLRFLGRYNDENPYANSAVAAIYLHRRTITQAEHISLYENPWRLLKRQDKRIWVPSAGGGGITITCAPGNATTAGSTAGISSAITIACTPGGASTAGVACALPIKIACNVGNATPTGIACSLQVVVQCNAGTATTAGVSAGIALDSSITISCNAGTATTSGVSASFPQTLSCTPGNATTAGNSATFPQSHPATGVLVAQAASISGTAVVATVGTHASSGALAAQTAVIDGASTVVHKFPTTGVLVAAAATISGSAVVTPQSVTHPSTGQLVSDAAVVSGSAQVVRGAISRPSSDTSAGAWTPSTGSDLYAMIDEVSPDDSDYIIATTATSCTLALSSVADPLTSSGQVVSYRAWSSTSNGLTVTLKQGATTIATWTHATLPTTATTYQQALTSGECDAITDYSNLSLVMTST